MKAFIWVIPWGTRYRFEVYSEGAPVCPSVVDNALCSAIEPEKHWYCDNLTPSQHGFAEERVRTAFPDVQDLMWDRCMLLGQLPRASEIAAEIAAIRAKAEERLAPLREELDRLTAGRVVS